jgi:hypothetical protein
VASERLAFLAGKRLYSTVNRDVAAWIQTPSAHIPVGRIRATKEIDLLQMHAARGDTLQVGRARALHFYGWASRRSSC